MTILTPFRQTAIKLTIFVVIMVIVIAGLVAVFANYRPGGDTQYKALFTSSSGIKSGARVRIAGVEVGGVRSVHLTKQHQALVTFTVDDTYRVPRSVHALIRYANLTGDRYLELQQGTGDVGSLRAGATIPIAQTEPALDLDKLLGGFRPVLQTLKPDEVNQLTSTLVAVFQGQSGAMQQLLSDTATFTESLADRDDLIGSVITNLNETLRVLDDDKKGLATSIDTLNTLVTGLASDRLQLGQALQSTSGLVTNMADLLSTNRPGLHQLVTNTNNVADQVLSGEGYIRSLLPRLPGDYEQLADLGSYGGWLQLWLCAVTIRFNGPPGSQLEFRAINLKGQQNPGGRCNDRME